MVLTPQGHISRYFYGVDFPPKDLRMGLVEASQDKIGNAVDQVLLYCYHYDPATGKYGAVVSNMLKLGGGAHHLDSGRTASHLLPPGTQRAAQSCGARQTKSEESRQD